MATDKKIERVEDISLLDPLVQSDPFEAYDLLRAKCPVYRMPETGFYVVTRYESLRKIFKDPTTFSNAVKTTRGLQGDLDDLFHSILAERGWDHIPTLQRTDPPVHSRYRKLVDRVFTAKRIREMRAHIDSVAHELIDTWIDEGECDFNTRFAMPLPGIIIAEQLGLNRNDIGTFKKWADAMLALGTKRLTEEELRAAAETELEAQHFLSDIFEQRRRAPQDDLISALVHSHGKDEAPLSVHELQNLMHQLITGGFETTQSAICHGMWLLLRHPEQMRKLRSDLSRIPAFVEECLRFESPVQGMARQTTKDVKVDGVVIPADSTVLIRHGAANRDPEKFECPHAFDIDRPNAGSHLAFGSGVHFCPGASLARQEMISSFEALLQRLHTVELARQMPDPAHHPSLSFLPIKELPIRFTGS